MITWLFTQVWLWSLASFALGVLINWLLFVRPLRRRLAEVTAAYPDEYEDYDHAGEYDEGPFADAPLDLVRSAPPRWEPADEPTIGDWERPPRAWAAQDQRQNGQDDADNTWFRKWDDEASRGGTGESVDVAVTAVRPRVQQAAAGPQAGPPAPQAAAAVPQAGQPMPQAGPPVSPVVNQPPAAEQWPKAEPSEPTKSAPARSAEAVVAAIAAEAAETAKAPQAPAEQATASAKAAPTPQSPAAKVAPAPQSTPEKAPQSPPAKAAPAPQPKSVQPAEAAPAAQAKSAEPEKEQKAPEAAETTERSDAGGSRISGLLDGGDDATESRLSGQLRSLFEDVETPGAGGSAETPYVPPVGADATQVIPKVEGGGAEQSALPRRTPGAGPRPGREVGSGPMIKGHSASRQYHSPDSPQYDDIVADVWFRTASDAEIAGFQPWSGQRTT
ncbi:sunset domain-containing protein [Saccharopolyspora sp. 5N708]|uniref:sunset domain-containing protein n=1 Tax=Saccharopolyspora sp. 5N708 TaxID=3457424 RepID=UPI003FD05728